MNGRDYMALVKEQPCVICRMKLDVINSPCDAHHVGVWADRIDWATAALCKEHHQGATGVHGLQRRGFDSFWKTSPIQLLAWTIESIHK